MGDTMIIEKILGNIRDYPVGTRTIDHVFIEWYELDKKLLRTTTEAGEEVGIRVETHLHEGDILYADDTRVLVLDLLPTELTVIPVHTMLEMGRLCFELGNRHLSLAIEEDHVSVPYDEPTFLYLEKLGYEPEKKQEKFSHFTVCKAHGGAHGHAHTHEHTHAGGHSHE